MDRLFVVVRADLVPAQRAVQAMHAQRLFGAEHPEVEEAWYRSSNTLALLEVPGPVELAELRDRAAAAGLRASVFREPDLGDEETALALEPKGKRLCRALPRALGGR